MGPHNTSRNSSNKLAETVTVTDSCGFWRSTLLKMLMNGPRLQPGIPGYVLILVEFRTHLRCYLMFFRGLQCCSHPSPPWQNAATKSSTSAQSYFSAQLMLLFSLFPSPSGCSADGSYEVKLMTKAIVHHTGDIIWQPPAIYKEHAS
jgi:hypothetical protein